MECLETLDSEAASVVDPAGFNNIVFLVFNWKRVSHRNMGGGVDYGDIPRPRSFSVR